MEAIYSAVLFLHVAAGFTSLSLFWIPVMVKKGGRVHNIIGKLYTVSMAFVAISAFLLCVVNCFRGRLNSAIFLGYLSILTAYPLYVGYYSLRMKKEVTDRYLAITKTFVIVLVVAAVLMALYAYTIPSGMFKTLMFIFAFLGSLQVRNVFKSKASVRANFNWLHEHISGMMSAGIAAHTAFAAFGGRHFLVGILSDSLMVLPWILPTVIGVTIIKVMKRKYSSVKISTSIAVLFFTVA